MRIGMLLDKPFPHDPRVANEARSLIDAGHEVFLFCLAPRPAAPRETRDRLEIVRYSIGERFWRKASALILTVPAYRLWFRHRLPGFLRSYGIEALHVHDLPLVGEGLRAARGAGIPCIADLHENYPAAVRLYDWARRFPGRWLVHPQRWDAYERAVLPKVDRIVVVIEEARARLLAQGLPDDRIVVVENTVPVDEFERLPRDAALIRRLREHFSVTYVGKFDRHRGLETAVDAARIARRAMPELLLVLVGTGATEPALVRRVRDHDLRDVVAFEGWQPFDRFASYVEGSALGLIPHLKSPHTDTTIPHKLFHFMLLARAVVATDCAPIARILRRTGAGRIYRSGDPEALAQVWLELRDQSRREDLGAAGREAVLSRYRWDVSARRLIDLYAGL
ncbi:MAG: glycosyltransferase [Candidatus Eisenbacteria bacterium]|nr:glycosyltransferase [Candidatus Eisenbacteria bacterium]